MSKQRRLGKGIDALLQGRDLSQLEGELNSVRSVPIGNLRPNPDQPRKDFAAEPLADLARSIEERGIIQPILAEEQPDGTYVIIAGERRYRAAEIAGLTVVPVIPGEFTADEKLEIALIENIQREDLNPIEEARAYKELQSRTSMSQDEMAKRLGMSRPALANALRLLKLPSAVIERVAHGELSAGHARTLLGLESVAAIEQLAASIVANDLSVRTVERLVALLNDGVELESALAQGDIAYRPEGGRQTEPDIRTRLENNQARSQDRSGGKTIEMRELEQRLIERLGTRVVLSGSNDKGKIEIAYLSMDDLDRIIELLLEASQV